MLLWQIDWEKSKIKDQMPQFFHHYLLPSLRGICRSYIDRGQDQAKEHLMTAKLWPQTLLSVFWCLSQTSGKHWRPVWPGPEEGRRAAQEASASSSLHQPPSHLNLCLLRASKGETRQGRVRERRGKGRDKRGGYWWLTVP